jgi:hypothetical protein
VLESRTVCQLRSLCPAAYIVGETAAGSGVLCRVTGRVVASGTDPSSLAAYCCAPVALARGAGPGGEVVQIGYQACPSWLHNRKRELGEKHEWPEGTPQRIKDAYTQFVTRA